MGLRGGPSKADDAEGSGLAREVGMYDALPTCLVPGEPWAEYGIVERRYRDRHPDAFAAVVERYGHREQGQGKSCTSGLCRPDHRVTVF